MAYNTVNCRINKISFIFTPITILLPINAQKNIPYATKVR
jgi:hypothetical protein